MIACFDPKSACPELHRIVWILTFLRGRRRNPKMATSRGEKDSIVALIDDFAHTFVVIWQFLLIAHLTVDGVFLLLQQEHVARVHGEIPITLVNTTLKQSQCKDVLCAFSSWVGLVIRSPSLKRSEHFGFPPWCCALHFPLCGRMDARDVQEAFVHMSEIGFRACTQRSPSPCHTQ